MCICPSHIPAVALPIATRVTVQELELRADEGDSAPRDGERAAVLSLPEGFEWLSQDFRTLFKRDFYDRFVDVFARKFENRARGTKNGNRILVMGTPGIGKSSFALYAVWRALQMGKTVVYQHHGTPDEYKVLTPKSGVVRVVMKPSKPEELADPNAVFVVDGMTPVDAAAFTLFVSSPNRQRTYEWSKAATTYFFPTWTLNELKLMRTHCYGGWSQRPSGEGESVKLTDEELKRRFEAAGGVPRLIFREEKWRQVPSSMHESASAAVNMLAQFLVDKGRVFLTSHRAIHLVVNRDTFDLVRLDFASSLARQLIYDHLQDGNRAAMINFMQATRGDATLAGFRGVVHENLVARHASSVGGSWMARSLSGRQDRLEIPLSKSGSVTTFDNIEELAPGPADTPILWRPRITNYTATDLILTVGTKVFFLQCTVANTHLVALRTDSGPPGLLQQAGILAKRGFDTGGELNYVHVTEARTEAVYTTGALTGGGGKSGEVSDRDRKRVQQWVVGFTPLS